MFTFHLCPCSVLHLNTHLSSHVLQVPIPNYGSIGHPKGRHLRSAFPGAGSSEGFLSSVFPEHLVFTSALTHHIPPWIMVITVYIWYPMRLRFWKTIAGPCPPLHHSAPRKEELMLNWCLMHWIELNWNTWGLFYNSVNSSVPGTITCWKLGGFCALIAMNWKTIWEVNLRLRKDSAQRCFGSTIFTATHLSVCLHKHLPVLNSCFGKLKTCFCVPTVLSSFHSSPLKREPKEAVVEQQW